MPKAILKISLALLIFFVNICYVNAGGPWLLKKGKGYFQFQITPLAYAYDRLLNGSLLEATEINREVYALDYGFYAEYGLTNKLNVIANIPFKYAKVGNLTDTPDAFQTLLGEGHH